LKTNTTNWLLSFDGFRVLQNLPPKKNLVLEIWEG
jgi:hypothetical protein